MIDRAALRSEYSDFLTRADGSSPVLLTGHSHQAWPRAARDGMLACYEDAARLVDDKWRVVAEVESEVRRKILHRLGFDEGDDLVFGKSTHELVYRLLTCLPAGARVVTTTGEFHSLHRQLSRLEEDGLRVEWVDAAPRDTLVDRLAAATTEGTALVAVSAVLFEDATIVVGLDRLLERASDVGALALVDAYHAFNVVPLDVVETVPRHRPRQRAAWETAFVTAGGYKYAQLGEGVCFMRLPRSASGLRPAYTGWFADYASLERPRVARSSESQRARVAYGDGGARFAGATFDPVSLYRARAVLAHFDRFGLDVPELRAISIAQTSRLVDLLDRGGAEIVSPRDPALRGGFVAIRCARAHDAVTALRARSIHVDARGDVLRAGPAPYLTDDEIARGAAGIIDVVRALR